MKYLTLTTLAATLVLSGNANAVVMTFDDVPGGSVQGIYGAIGTYQGFNFSCIDCSNTDRLDWVDTGSANAPWPYGSVSGDFTMLNNYGGTGIITEANNADFTFSGLWAKAWATAPESGGPDTLFGTLSGYNNGSLVWEVATGLNGSFEYYDAQAGAIDELRLGFGTYFLVDNLALNEVPVPAAFWLFASGLLGLMGVAKRKTRA